MVDSELHTLLLGNNSSKMETRKDGRQEHKQIKKEWQKYE
jgi:hypothetical protein